MLTSVSLNATFSEEDYVRVLRQMQREMFVKKYGFLIISVIAFLCVLAIILFGRESTGVSIPTAIIGALISALFLGGVVFLIDQVLSPVLLRRTIRKQFKVSLLLRNRYEITINEEGVSSKSDMSSQSLGWEAYIRGIETETDFLFYTSNKFSGFLPKSAFSSTEEIDFLRDLARRKLGAKAEF